MLRVGSSTYGEECLVA